MTQQENNLQEATKAPEDFGVKDFMVGKTVRTLTFTAALRFRLFLNVEPSQVQAYVSTEAFKLTALGLLLLGKSAIGMPVEDMLDAFEDLELTDDQAHLIYEWVLKRTINFMLKEAEATAQAVNQAMPEVKQLISTLDGSQQ